MTKLIDVPEDEPTLPASDDRSVFDSGRISEVEPMTLEQMEAKVLPVFNARQKKIKLARVQVMTKESFRKDDVAYYHGRPRSTGSETRRRSVNSLGRLVGDHGAHKIQGAYGKLKDDAPDAPVPTFHPAPETTVGYCNFCHGPIGPGMKAGSKFCSGAHRTAFHRKEEQRNEFNKAFKDYWETAKGNAEAVLQADARHVAAVEMKESAARLGINAEFFATSAGVMARADTPLPPVRFTALSKTGYGADIFGPKTIGQVLEVQTSDVIELGAKLYAFDFPMYQSGSIGKMRWLRVRFLGDTGTDYEWSDGFLTAEQEAILARKNAEIIAGLPQEKLEWARRARARAERKARGGPGTTSAREAHQEERMKNLLARPDHDQIIRDFEEAKDWYGLKEFYNARRRQELKNSSVTDSGNKKQSKQRVS